MNTNKFKFDFIRMQAKEIKNQTVVIKQKKTSFYLPNGQYDILAINDVVRTTLKKNKIRMNEIEERLKQLELIIQLNPREEQIACEEIFNLNREFRLLKEVTNLDEFEEESVHLLEIYKTYEHGLQDDFFGTRNKVVLGKLSQIIDKYVTLSKRYIEIPPRKYQLYDSSQCEHCNSNDWDNSTEGGMICMNCGFAIDLLDGCSSTRNGKIVKIVTKSNPLDKHLLDAILQMECKQNKEISDDVYVQIYKEMDKKKLKPERLLKTDLHKILQYIGYNEYHDVHKIHFEITKKPPISLYQWSSEIMQDHMLYQRTYDQIKEKSNAQNKFYKLLRMCIRREDFIPRKDDWFMIEEKISLYEADAEKICNILGWEYKELIFNNFA